MRCEFLISVSLLQPSGAAAEEPGNWGILTGSWCTTKGGEGGGGGPRAAVLERGECCPERTTAEAAAAST